MFTATHPPLLSLCMNILRKQMKIRKQKFQINLADSNHVVKYNNAHKNNDEYKTHLPRSLKLRRPKARGRKCMCQIWQPHISNCDQSGTN